MSFQKELAHLLNKYSQETGSGTPDFILAHYLADCLRAWDRSVAAREHWYGRRDRPERTEEGGKECLQKPER